MNTERERRNHQRYQVKDGTLALNSTVLGPVLNISLGGMLFEYYSNDLGDENIVTLGFYAIDSEFLVTGLKCETIRDTVVNNSIGLLPLIRKQRAVEFLDPTSAQRMLLKRFIKMHSRGPT